MDNETYVTFDQANILKRIGYDWVCGTSYYTDGECHIFSEVIYPGEKTNFNSEGWYIPHVSAPAIHTVAKWLREVQGIFIEINTYDGVLYNWHASYLGIKNKERLPNYGRQYKTYEEALSDAITHILCHLDIRHFVAQK